MRPRIAFNYRVFLESAKTKRGRREGDVNKKRHDNLRQMSRQFTTIWTNSPRGAGHLQPHHQSSFTDPCPTRQCHPFSFAKRTVSSELWGPISCKLLGKLMPGVLPESARPTWETHPTACLTPPGSLSEMHERMKA